MSPLLPGIIASGISGHLFTPEGSAYELASYTVPAGGIAAVTLAVPSGYRHIEVQWLARDTGSASMRNLFYRLNGDTGNNYSWHDIEGVGSGVYAYSATSTNKAWAAYYPTASQTANVFGAGVMSILDYANTAKNKTVRCIGGVDTNGDGIISQSSAGWYNTSAVSSITFIAEQAAFAENSQFTLIGYK